MLPFFTSDHHFGHARMILHASRPFASVDEMDEEMIEHWNAVVPSKGSVVYHLGDFSMGDHTPYLRRLNGEKHLIVGNHDHRKRLKKAVGWASIEMLRHIKIGEIQITLCHYAMRTWRNSHHGALHFYGHSHGNLPGDAQSLDVGVDCWGFRPVSLEQIGGRLASQQSRVEMDHHQPQASVVGYRYILT